MPTEIRLSDIAAAETKTVELIKVHELLINPIKGQLTTTHLMALSLDRQKLIDWYEAQKAEEQFRTSDPNHPLSIYQHAFKTESPLHWYNPLKGYDIDERNQGINAEWIEVSRLHEVVKSLEAQGCVIVI